MTGIVGAGTDVLGFDLPAALEASAPPEERGLRRDGVRLLIARRGSATIEHRAFADITRVLEAGDVLVVNTSATLPAALVARTAAGRPAELHLSTAMPGGHRVVELRHPADRVGAASTPWLDAGESTVLELPGGGRCVLRTPAVTGPVSGGGDTVAGGVRLWVASLELPMPLLPYLARYGRPIRYGYVTHDRPISAYQTVFADEPGSAEMPSAARPFSAEVVTRLVTRGIVFAPFVLHTGVSSPEAHEAPYAEWYRIGAETAARINAGRHAGHRVIAVGTTAVRALETVVDGHGRVHPGEGWTDVVVGAARGVRAVDGMVTGWHEPRASHLAMLEAVAGRGLLEASYAAALAEGYLWHEFGDSHLILP